MVIGGFVNLHGPFLHFLPFRSLFHFQSKEIYKTSLHMFAGHLNSCIIQY